MISRLFGVTLASFCLVACNQPSATGTPGATGTTTGTTIGAPENTAPEDTAYAVQGEYLGVDAATGDTLGAQVAAEGQNNFSLLLLNGGLPGRGWNGQNGELLSGVLQ